MLRPTSADRIITAAVIGEAQRGEGWMTRFGWQADTCTLQLEVQHLVRGPWAHWRIVGLVVHCELNCDCFDDFCCLVLRGSTDASGQLTAEQESYIDPARLVELVSCFSACWVGTGGVL